MEFESGSVELFHQLMDRVKHIMELGVISQPENRSRRWNAEPLHNGRTATNVLPSGCAESWSAPEHLHLVTMMSIIVES
jgi:hypothetical protein